MYLDKFNLMVNTSWIIWLSFIAFATSKVIFYKSLFISEAFNDFNSSFCGSCNSYTTNACDNNYATVINDPYSGNFNVSDIVPSAVT